MLSDRIDRALDALHACRTRLPAYRDLFGLETPERAALDKLLAVLAEADEVFGIGRGRRERGL